MAAMDLNALRVFVQVVAAGSFIGAAKALSMPSSNVSRAVAQLEAHLGALLLVRSTRSMRLTEAGRLLYADAQPLLAQLARTEAQLGAAQDELVGTLRLSLPSEGGPALLGGVLAAFARAHPRLQLSIQTSAAGVEVLQENVDLALLFHRGALADSSIVVRPLATFPSVVVAAPELIARVGQPKTLAQLKRLPCITTLSALEGLPWQFAHADGRIETVNVHSHYRVNSGLMATEAALAGVGFAILAQSACAEAVAAGRLQILTLPQAPLALTLLAAYPTRDYRAPAVGQLLDVLVTHFQTLA